MCVCVCVHARARVYMYVYVYTVYELVNGYSKSLRIVHLYSNILFSYTINSEGTVKMVKDLGPRPKDVSLHYSQAQP